MSTTSYIPLMHVKYLIRCIFSFKLFMYVFVIYLDVLYIYSEKKNLCIARGWMSVFYISKTL